MKYFISLIFSLVFSFLIFSPVIAQESDDWSEVMKDYNSTDFGKIISTPEYKKAIETKENFINKNKKTKKIKKNKNESGQTTETKPEEKAVLDAPDTSNPLLILPVDVFYENNIIKQGFYLVNLKYTEGKYFLELMQGNNLPVAIIEAKGNIAPAKSILKPQVSVENVSDKIIKIHYKGDNLILEASLWVY